MTYLIADSGSTKSSWVLVEKEKRQDFETLGINPIRDNEGEIEQVLMNLPVCLDALDIIHFYGAGCIPPYSDVVRRLLARRFPKAEIHVESDLLGAAHALCGKEEGIACILGTGSNSCLYDGRHIVENVSPLGWILGDEGSGAVLGRRLVGDVLKGQFSPALCQAFADETGLTRTDIISKVYKEPMPNRFLASLVPFLNQHKKEAEIQEFLINEFRSFFRRNVATYKRSDLPVSFVGGVAHTYRNELSKAAKLEGFTLGRILQKPIEGIVDYILNTTHHQTL
ncbi:MAG: ATPase [Bacteroidaceae bacterium]|nr:ATPase [Bacteroidaceae bacterium]